MVEPLGRRSEAESGTQRLEAETRDPPATTPMETGRPVANPELRWWAEGEQRGCQEPAVAELKQQGYQEEAGKGGWVGGSRFLFICHIHNHTGYNQ